jgi:glutamate racemase
LTDPARSAELSNRPHLHDDATGLGPKVAHRPIGVFDSGLGGLTVAAAIAARLPQESMVYLGDTARVPYGSRSPGTIVRYAHNNIDFLHQRQVKLVVVACNTVSAQDLGPLLHDAARPVVEVIGPGARAALAASAGGDIAVLGTRSTVRSAAYERAIHRLDPTRRVHSLACPLFVPLVEEGFIDHAVTTQVAEEYLAGLRDTAVDTLVLGCTHYPLLRAVITRVAQAVLGRSVAVVDSATAVAAEVADLLAAARAEAAGPAQHLFCVTDHPERTEEVAGRFWGRAVGGAALQLEHVDLVPR